MRSPSRDIKGTFRGGNKTLWGFIFNQYIKELSTTPTEAVNSGKCSHKYVAIFKPGTPSLCAHSNTQFAPERGLEMPSAPGVNEACFWKQGIILAEVGALESGGAERGHLELLLTGWGGRNSQRKWEAKQCPGMQRGSFHTDNPGSWGQHGASSGTTSITDSATPH